MELELAGELLDQKAALAVARAEYESARLRADAETKMTEEGIVPAIQSRQSQLLAEQLKIRMEIEQERLSQFAESMRGPGLRARGARRVGTQRLRAPPRGRRVATRARGLRRRRCRKCSSRKGSASRSARTSRASPAPTTCRQSCAFRKPKRETCRSARL